MKMIIFQPHHPQDAYVGKVEEDQEGQEGHQEVVEHNCSLSDVKLKRVVPNSGLLNHFSKFVFPSFVYMSSHVHPRSILHIQCIKN